MPAIPLSRSNAWEFWKIGRIAATNIDNIGVDAPGTPPILGNLAIKHGFNAVRYWLNWGITPSSDYTLLPKDWQKIAWEGWGSTTVTTRTEGTANPLTIAMVATQVQRVLDKCQALGLGVILTGNFLGESGGRLWKDRLAGSDGWGATTAAGLQGDLGLFWQKTITRFGTHPALIGIDLLNEPQPTTGLSIANARSATRTDTWPRLAQYLIAVIRQVDASAQSSSSLPRIPLIVEGTLEAGQGLNLFLNPANGYDNSYLLRDYTYGAGNSPNTSRTDDRIVYSSHAYLPAQIAGQGVFDDRSMALGTSYPITTLARDWINSDGVSQAVIRDFTTDSGWNALFEAENKLGNQLGQPVWIGEFGSVQPRLDYIYPASTIRGLLQQRVTEAPVLSASTDPTTLADFRQVTRVTYDAVKDSYTLGLDNITDSSFQPVSWLDSKQVTEDRTYLEDNFTIGPLKRPLDAYSIEVPVGGWRTNWFASQGLLATLYWTGVDGKPVMTSTGFQDLAVQIVGGVRSITVKASSLTSALPIKLLGTANAAGKYPVVGVLAFNTSRTAGEIDNSRAEMAKAILRVCQRKKFSWAHFCEDIDYTGFVGWRPSPAIHDLLSKAARGDTL